MAIVENGIRVSDRPDVREIVDPERIMVADGAMGTMLYVARRVHQSVLR